MRLLSHLALDATARCVARKGPRTSFGVVRKEIVTLFQVIVKCAMPT